MLLKYCLSLVLLFLPSGMLFSQMEPCGTIDESYIAYQSFKVNKNIDTRSEYVLPLKVHIITDRGGDCQANVNDIIDEIALSSTYFAPLNISLDLCEIDYIQNADFFHFNMSDGFELISLYNKEHVLNLYIVQSLSSRSGAPICGVARFPWADHKLMIVTSSCSTNGSTIAHEIGHYLGLYHTHHSSFGVELADQGNCEIAGDRICDTPADPGLSYRNVNTICKYTGSDIDTNGDNYMPLPELVMSSAPKLCRNTFTPEQGVIMKNIWKQYYSDYRCTSEEGSEIGVFPNPATSIINIVLHGKLSFTSNLYTQNGKLIKSAINETSMDVSTLPNGIYILEINDPNSGTRFVERVVITR